MIKAVLFDVDGTLYHRWPLQMLMAGELGTVPWAFHAPWNVPRLWRMLSVFRRVREELRELGRPAESLGRLQYVRAAERAGVAASAMETAVEEWILRRPLKYMPGVIRRGTSDVLGDLGARGMLVGAFSDYPVDRKLDALGLRRFVTLELDASAETINAFKPHPRGLLVACEHWGLAPHEVLYVGDRVEVDAKGAAALGMPCVIVGASSDTTGAGVPYMPLADIRDLPTHLDTCGQIADGRR